MSILLGNGDGTFRPAVTYNTGPHPQAVAVADLNGDGKLDLVVANNSCYPAGCSGNGGGAVAILLGNGDGTFQAAKTTVTEDSISSISIADLNSDGKLDVVAAALGSAPSETYVLLGNGDGTFQAPVAYFTANKTANSAAVADVNGDGILDIVVGNECYDSRDRGCSHNGGLGVLLGNGDGTFRGQESLTLAFSSGAPDATAIAIADVNGDGRPDLVAANTGYVFKEANVPSSVGVLLNELTVGTTAKVASSLDPSSINQSVTFTATISSPSSPVPNGSTVTFYNGATEIGTGTTTNGVATLTTSFSAAGKFTIKASYAGDAFHKGNSGKVKQTVNP